MRHALRQPHFQFAPGRKPDPFHGPFGGVFQRHRHLRLDVERRAARLLATEAMWLETATSTARGTAEHPAQHVVQPFEVLEPAARAAPRPARAEIEALEPGPGPCARAGMAGIEALKTRLSLGIDLARSNALRLSLSPTISYAVLSSANRPAAFKSFLLASGCHFWRASETHS